MKTKTKVLFIILFTLVSCTPFKWAAKPVKMNYAVNIYDQTSVNIGYVLCEDYKISKNNTLYLQNAGYYSRLKKQRSVADMVFPNYWRYAVTILK